MSNDASNESPSGKRQILLPRRLPLASFSGAPAAGGHVTFFLPVPDLRLHWQFTVIAVPENNAGPGGAGAVLAGRGGKIWVAACEDDNAGGGIPVPVTDILGTFGLGHNFPSDQNGVYDTALGGISVENDGAACAGIQGYITFPAQGGGPEGSLYLQARYQPNVGHFFMPEEWEEITALCVPRLMGKALVT